MLALQVHGPQFAAPAKPAVARAMGMLEHPPALFLILDGKVIGRTAGAMPVSQIGNRVQSDLGQAAA